MRTRTVVLFAAGPAWVKGRSSREQLHWAGHAAFIDGLTERGVLLAGGPFPDESGALNILAGPPQELGVESLYAQDPFIVHGIFVLERVVPWLVFVDNWAPKATSR
jgi:uncharacterized protein YciI